jgi:UDP-N-acetylmuramoylalanine--D-glutamate ligase
MIAVATFAGKNVAVVGLGRSGLSSAQALRAGGTHVVVWDDADKRRAVAADEGFPVVPPDEMAWEDCSALVLSPGIPLTHPAPHPCVRAARAAGCEVIGDIELFARARLPARVAAITGTNGKSTTTALLGHVLAESGVTVAVGGNIGRPVLDLPCLPGSGVYVLEMSSYQIDLTPSLAAEVAVLLNLSPDHLDRHGGMAGYVAAKRRLFERQRPHQVAVVGVDDADSMAICSALQRQPGRRVVPISVRGVLDRGVYVRDGTLFDADGPAAAAIDLGDAPALRGEHNWQNAAAAYAAARALGCDTRSIGAAMRSFPGLPHRLEEVATVEGIRLINDSKATNADAAARALACFDTIYWIAGGRAKDGGIASLAPWFSRISGAFLIGEAADSFAAELAGKVPARVVGTLDAAVLAALDQARNDRRPGAVVLLSPACASFDQFRDFEERGDRFRDIARGLQALHEHAVPAPEVVS